MCGLTGVELLLTATMIKTCFLPAQSTRLEVTLNEPDSGFLVRRPPLASATISRTSPDPGEATNSARGGVLETTGVGGPAVTEPEVQEYLITPAIQSAHLLSVRAEFGEFSASATVPGALLRRALTRTMGADRSPNTGGAGMVPGSSVILSTVIEDLDISAHIVMATISSDRPLLQVVFHANILPPYKMDARSRHTFSSSSSTSSFDRPSQTASTSTGRGPTSTLQPPAETKYCVTAHVRKSSSHIRAECVLSARSIVCLAEVAVPTSWWHAESAETATVFYSVAPLDPIWPCGGGAVQERNESEQVDLTYLGAVTLTHGQLTYEELKEDQHVLIYIPQASFYPGSKFRVPVKLQASSDLQIFVMKVKARHGVRVVGAEGKNSSLWKTTLDLNHKLHGAMVTAYIVTTPEKREKTDRVEDIFEWLFEVDEDASGDDRGRINFIVEYEMNVQQKETYRSVENRIGARVEIQRDNTYAIIPVIKTTELVNTAVLTGKVQNYAMRVYAVSHMGRLSDVTSQTTCHCGDEDALKVVESCNWVYMDGTETKGSSSVTIITKYGRHTKFIFFQVWMPEFPLEINLSDTQLSQIRGWKIPHQPARPPASPSTPLFSLPSTGGGGGAGGTSIRRSRGADFGILTHPALLLQEEGVRKEDMAASCELRYQSAVVQVFASFVMAAETGQTRYLGTRKNQFYVTDLVLSQLRVVDPVIASLEGNVVEGLMPGKTEIQILFKTGRVLGSTEITVSAEKVSIDRLQLDLISGLSLTINPSASELPRGPEQPRAIVARLMQNHQLKRKYQEALLKVAVRFDDGTILPLHYVPAADYFLDLDTLNNHVVAFGPPQSPDAPRVIALGQGKGELLKVSLELGDLCQRKKSRPLVASYAYVDIDFTRTAAGGGGVGEINVQSDAAPYAYDPSRRADLGRGALQPLGVGPKSADATKGTLHLSINGDSKPKSTAVGVESTGTGERPRDVQLRHLGGEEERGGGLSPLEVSMYSLLAVFCVAVIVFSVNCAVFLSRYRRKKGGGGAGVLGLGGVGVFKDPVNCSPDWVWIGRETLERNAINTACSEALMPEADFNGNHRSVSPEPPVTDLPPAGPEGQSHSPLEDEPDTSGPAPLRGGPTGGVGGSNRNSYISTYQGSECSIQITATNQTPIFTGDNNNIGEARAVDPVRIGHSRPLGGMGHIGTPGLAQNVRPGHPGGGGADGEAHVRTSERRLAGGRGRGGAEARPGGTLPRMGGRALQHGMINIAKMSSDSLDGYESSDVESVNHHRITDIRGRPMACERRAGHRQMTREQRLKELEEAVASGSDVEWDYDALGMTYTQVMDYFDNLKESTA